MIEVRPLPGDPLQHAALLHELAHRYLVWDAHVAGTRRVEVHPLVLPDTLHRSAVLAAESVTAAIGEAAARAQADPAERALYRLPVDAERLAAASFDAGDTASLVRVDLLLDRELGWVACEVNADCPGGHNEAVGLPRLARAAGFGRARDPTVVVPALARRLAHLARGEAVAILYATAYAEDLQVCALVARHVEALGVRALLCPPTAPRWDGRRLRVRGEGVGALYRFFPTEYMAGQANVGGLVAAVRAGAVRTLSSFAQIYAQSKFAFARAGAHPHLAPTADVADVGRGALVEDRRGWVLKRALGRVGEEVFVGALVDPEDGALVVDDVLRFRTRGELWLAQRYVRQRPVPTPWGDRFLTLGAYVLDGAFFFFFARATPESHAGQDAL
ncbi:MAG: glutathionylspermidine synthase family protein, partial [Myxococcales bacterium]|nr:glutathionylspermidine synthase family protein [Myxococcales bacterium]